MRRLILAVVVMLFSQPASADIVDPQADLVCNAKANVALARFAIYYANDKSSLTNPRPDFPTLPAQIDGGLSRDKGFGRTDCRLANGWTVRIRSGTSQLYLYGRGGADPFAYFTMWIAGRRVFNETWKFGGEAGETPMMIGLVLRPGGATVCFENHEPDYAPRCERKPFDLAKSPIDRREYPPPGVTYPLAGTMLILPQSTGGPLCERYRRAARTDPASIAKGLAEEVPFEDEPQAFTGEDGEAWSTATTASSWLTRVRPGGPLKRIVMWEGEARFLYGDIAVIVPGDVSAATVLKTIVLRRRAEDYRCCDVEEELAKPRPPGWKLISGGMPGFYPDVAPSRIRLRAKRIDGRLYFLAYPSDEDNKPSEMLVAVRDDGSIAPVCSFERVRPHF